MSAVAAAKQRARLVGEAQHRDMQQHSFDASGSASGSSNGDLSHPHHPYQHHEQSRSRSLNMYDDRGHHDDSLDGSPTFGERDEFDELGDMSSDVGLQERLLVAQRVQEEAAATGVFPCPYCAKEYNGKHARSIWRRHLQDKHGIPLSQQPRRTRWDGDANRPKNAEERRQRMLESKRRWARKKRMSEKQGRETSPSNDGGTAPPEASGSQHSYQQQHHAQQQAQQQSQQQQMYDFPLPSVMSGDRSAGAYGSFPAPSPGTVQRYLGGPSGGLDLYSNVAPLPAPSSSSSSSTSPRRAPLGLIDANMSSSHGVQPHAGSPVRRGTYPPHPSSSGGSGVGSSSNAPFVDGPSMPRPQSSHASGLRAYPTPAPTPLSSQQERQMGQQQQQSMDARTPVNCYTQLYPTPPSLGDAERGLSSAASAFAGARSMAMERISSGGAGGAPGGGRGEFRMMAGQAQGGMSLLSPPSSTMNESSPAGAYASQQAQQHGPGGGIPYHSTPRAARLPARVGAVSAQSDNPFSLAQHKISPCAGEKSAHAGLQPHAPAGASALRLGPDSSGAPVEDPFSLDRHKISPEAGMKRERAASPAPLDLGGSPVRKRRLPPLVGTPLRDLDDEGTLLGLMLLGESGRKPGAAAAAAQREREEVGNDSGISLTPFGKLRGVVPGTGLRGTTATAGIGAGALTRPTPMGSRKRRETDQFSSPQHLDLTASLGLAPHSVRRAGAGSATPGFGFGYGGGATPLGATPFAAKLGSAAWPDSTFNPLRYSRTVHERERDAGAIAEDDDEGDEEDARFENDTPSRAGVALRRGANLALGAAGTPAGKNAPPRLRPLTFGASSSSVAGGDEARSASASASAARMLSPATSDVSLSDEEEEDATPARIIAPSAAHKRGHSNRSRTISYTGSPLKTSDAHAGSLMAGSPRKAARRAA